MGRPGGVRLPGNNLPWGTRPGTSPTHLETDRWNVSVFKNIPIGERFKVQLRAEIFNLLNRINLAAGGGSVSQGSGFVTDNIGDFNGAPGIGPDDAFNMQLAAKVIFPPESRVRLMF